MSESDDRTEDADRVTADAPAEGSEAPGDAGPSTTPHPQDPAEGVDPDKSPDK